MGALLRRAAQGRRRGAQGRRPGLEDDPRGAAERRLDGAGAIYAAGGRGAFDVVALHPYTRRPADVVRFVRYVRDGMRRRGDGTHADLGDGALVAGAEGRRSRRSGSTRPSAARPRAWARAAPARRERARCGSSACTGTRGCRGRGSPAARSTTPGCAACARGHVRSAPALAAFQRAGAAARGLREAAGDALRCR